MSIKPIQGYRLIKPEDLSWQTSRIMQIPDADFLERTGSMEEKSKEFVRNGGEVYTKALL